MRGGWWRVVLPAVVAVPSVVLLLVGALSTHDDTTAVPARSVLVGTVQLRVTRTADGAVLSATVLLRADRPVHLRGVRIHLRDAQGRDADAAGRPFSLPDTGPVDLGVVQRRLTSAGVVHTSGPFSYVLEYRTGTAWTPLPPFDTVTIS